MFLKCNSQRRKNMNQIQYKKILKTRPFFQCDDSVAEAKELDKNPQNVL